jgi:ComF family protein
LSQEVQLIKYRRQRWRLPRLVELLTPTIEDKPELITCVPLHWQRQWYRGFNQSDLMGRLVASQLGVPYLPAWFKRHRSTPYQRGLNHQQRQNNVRHAFTLQQSLSPPVSHVAICDDVVTTGSTVNQLCKLLLDVGVKRIDIYCLCRTSSDFMD